MSSHQSLSTEHIADTGTQVTGLARCYSTQRAALLWLVCFSMIALRKPDSILNPQFMAEDGTVFFVEQLSMGVRAIVEPYNGYFLLLPRVLAQLASVLPILYVPLAYSLLGALIHSVSLTWFFHPLNRFLLAPDILRAIVAVILAAVLQGEEMLGNLFNCHWHLLPTAMLLLAAGRDHTRPPRQTVTAGLACALFVIGMTSSMSVVALPFALWHVVRPHGRRQTVAWAFVVAMGIQIATFVVFRPPSDGGVSRLSGDVSLLGLASHATYATALSWVFRPVLGSLVGTQMSQVIGSRHAVATAIVVIVLVAGAVAWLLRRSDGFVRRLIGAALVLSVLSIAVPLVLRNLLDFVPMLDQFTFFYAPRYFVLAASVFVWIVALTVDRGFQSRHVAARACIVALTFSCGMVSNFTVAPYRDLDWPRAAKRIESWQRQASTGERQQAVVVAINPVPWHFVVGDLDRESEVEPSDLRPRLWNSSQSVDGGERIPVYRLLHAPSGQYLWTTDGHEYLVLAGSDWIQQGIEGYCLRTPISDQTSPLYRLALPGSTAHRWTSDLNEIAALVAHGWANEGVMCEVKTARGIDLQDGSEQPPRTDDVPKQSPESHPIPVQ